MRAFAFCLLLIGCDAAIEPVPEPVLGAPTGLGIASATPTTVTLRWRAPEAPVDGFEIRTGCTADCPTLYPEVLATVSADSLQYTARGLVDLGAHQFQVVALGVNGARAASAGLRVEYPDGGVLSTHPLPTQQRAYLDRSGEVAYQYGAVPSELVSIETATGIVESVWPRFDAGYDTIVMTLASGSQGGRFHSVLVYDTAGPGAGSSGALLSPSSFNRKDFEHPGGPLLFEREGIEGLSVGPPRMEFVLGSYQAAEGRRLMAWRQRVDMTLAPELVAGFESAVPIGATSGVGVLVLLDPASGQLYGVYVGDPEGVREVWRIDAGWPLGSDVVPQIDTRLASLAFTTDGHHHVVDASIGNETMSVPAGERERVVALGGRYVVVSDGDSLSFLDMATGQAVRRLPVRPVSLDGQIAVEGRHVVAVADGVTTVIVSETGVRSVRRWVLDATWQEAPAQ